MSTGNRKLMENLFEWDENKRLTNIEKHRIDFVDAVKIFKAFVHTVQDKRADYGEIRYVSTGLLYDIEITVIHTPRNGRRRIISARRARPKERQIYHEEALKMGTDFEALRSMKDEDIDCSDIPEITEEYYSSVESLWETPDTEGIYLSLNRNALDYFRKTGRGYLNRLNTVMNELLKGYVAEHQKAEGVI